jgi:ankyrin repeat protein
MGEDKIAEKLTNGGALVNPELILKTPEISECGLYDDDMDRNGSSPLGAAFATLITSRYATLQRTRCLKVIRLLLDRGAVVYSGVRKASPLWLAIESCYKFSRRQESIVKLLLSKGADINFRDTEEGFSPLHRAVANKVVPMVELILKGKPKLDVQDFEGRTPLHAALSWASGNDVDTIVHMPLKAGSDPNIASVEGIALHPAAKEGRLGCVKLLLTAGADANAKDHECRTPLDLAQLELEDERNNREPPGIFFRPRDTEALMKIVELLRPITTEMVAGTDITLERASQSESLPSTPAAHSKSGS